MFYFIGFVLLFAYKNGADDNPNVMDFILLPHPVMW